MGQNTVSILEFGAPLCSACQEVEQTLKAVLSETTYSGRVGFQKLNGLENIPTLTKFGLADGSNLLEDTAFPVTIFMKNGKEVSRRTDAFSKEQARQILNGLLGISATPNNSGDLFAGRQFNGGIIIRTFYQGTDKDADYLKVKPLIINTIAHEKLFRRAHFEWGSRKALHARRYNLDQHPDGIVTILFDKDGKETGRILGVFGKTSFQKAIIYTFDAKKFGIINGSGKSQQAQPQPQAQQQNPKVKYADKPQRRLHLVEFYRDNCSSCKALEPTLHALDEKYKGWVELKRIHGENSPEMKKQYLRKAKNQMIFYPMVFIEDDKGRVFYNSDDYKKLQSELDSKLRDYMFRVSV